MIDPKQLLQTIDFLQRNCSSNTEALSRLRELINIFIATSDKKLFKDYLKSKGVSI
ncbi:MAG: hypothetical protein SFH39_00475 [Candidatus Magnetobacterium sp. LHC-1]